jgi:hypothetical protein
MRLRARTLVLCLGGATGAVLVAGQLVSACVFDFGDCTNLLTCDGGPSSSSSGTTSSSSGTGGADGGSPCTSAADCLDLDLGLGLGPDGGVPDGGVCVAYATCKAGQCSVAYVPGEATDQPYGTCTKRMCDTMGNVTTMPDDMNIWDAGDPCIVAGCSDGGPTYTVPAGVTCDAGSANSTEGTCVAGGSGGPLAACVQCTLGMATQDCVVTLSNCSLAPAGVEGSVQGYCVPAHCTDGTKNNGETDVDCGGGACAPCIDGDYCTSYLDCMSSVCEAVPPATLKTCQASTCMDSRQNGEETDVDCGGEKCPPCETNEGCLVPTDCASQVCIGGKCQAPTCTDGVQNGDETGVDCGGVTSACPPCPLE